MEEAPYDSRAMRAFVGTDLGRGAEMHRTKKGQQWYFGMKMHVGVDSQSKVIHTVAVTPANAADCKASPAQLTLARKVLTIRKFLTLSYFHQGHRT